jgi:hypothetical protein
VKGLLLAIAGLAGCYHPDITGGAPCATSAECPPGLSCEGGFCTGSAGSLDAASDGCAALHCEGTSLVTCGVGSTCPAGCAETGGPHCLVLVPSNGLTPAMLDGATADVGGTQWDFDTDTGRIRHGANELRPAGTGVKNGIGYQVVDSMAVFTAHSFAVPAGTTWTAHGDNSLALYAADTISVDGFVDVGANGTTGGPGGFGGGTTGSNAGCRGKFGGWTAAGFGEGGGGAGGNVVGGNGAPSTGSTFGAGGTLCDTHPTTSPLEGASGGGAGGYDVGGGVLRGGAGGGGGGAVALVAMNSVTINGAIGAPGAGGLALSGGDGGGGGGGGGAVLVEAPVVVMHGAVTANGGGGAGPSTDGGSRGHLDDANAAGAGSFNSRFGGRGCAGTTAPGNAQNYTDNATTPTISRGGGGGGACGRIELKSVTLDSTGIESPPAMHTQATVQ